MADYASTLGELHDYLNHLSRGSNRELTTEQEREEFEKAKQGNNDAKGKLITANLGLLQNVLRKFDYRAAKAGVSLCDLASDILVQVIGNTFDKYDPSRNVSIGNYLFQETFWNPIIKRRLHDYSKHGMKYAPMDRQISYSPLPAEGNDELDEVNTSVEERTSYYAIAKRQKELPNSADYAMHNIDCETLMTLVNPLIETEREIMRGIYFKGLPSAEIGKSLDISGSRVKQIRDRTLKKLKREVKKDIKTEKEKFA